MACAVPAHDRRSHLPWDFSSRPAALQVRRARVLSVLLCLKFRCVLTQVCGPKPRLSGRRNVSRSLIYAFHAQRVRHTLAAGSSLMPDPRRTWLCCQDGVRGSCREGRRNPARSQQDGQRPRLPLMVQLQRSSSPPYHYPLPALTPHLPLLSLPGVP